MAHINLLPWLEELRKQKQQQFGVIAGGAALVGGLLVLLGHMQMNGLIDRQNQRNEFLKAEITKLDERIAAIKDLEKEASFVKVLGSYPRAVL